MKRRLALALALLLIATTSISALGLLAPTQAAAAASCPGGRSTTGDLSGAEVGLCLVDKNGNLLSDSSSYQVQFNYSNYNNISKTIAASYHSSAGLFLTGVLSNTGSRQGSTCENGHHEPFSVKVTKDGKTYANYSAPTGLCTMPIGYISYVPISVSESAIQEGYIKGTITYIAADGSKQPFNGQNGGAAGGNDTVCAKLTEQGAAPPSNCNITLDGNGHITPSPMPIAVGTYTLTVGPWVTPSNGGGNIGTVTYTKTLTVTSSNTKNNPADFSGSAQNAQSGSSGGSSGSGSSDTSPTCESSGYGFAWALCGIINGMSDGVDWMYNSVIQPLLQIQPIDLSNPSADPTHAYAIWSDFRIYGDIFLVIALLIVVFGESIGGGVIDAYTAKKVLPRLLAAAILINISIYIVAIAVDVTNVIGDGINNLLQAPFQAQIKSGNFYVLQLHIGNVVNVAATLTLAAIVAALFHPGAAGNIQKTGFDGLLYFLVIVLIPAFFIFLAIMATVILRRGLLLFLIFLAPIAFALYCLPNTEKYFRQWWDLLFKTLLVYPIIAVMFALGNILSVTIAASTSGIAGGLASMIGVVCMLAPLFLIPYSFRIAGGLLGRFHELATQSATRGYQAIHGDDKNPDSMKNRARNRFGRSLNESNLSGKAFSNRLTSYAKGESFATRRERLAGIRETRAAKLAAEFGETDEVFKNNQNNDKYLAAVSDMNFAQQQLRDAQAKGDTAGTNAWTRAIALANSTPQSNVTRMAALQKLATTGFHFDDGEAGYLQLAQRIADATGAEAVFETDSAGNRHFKEFRGSNAARASNAMNNAQYSLRTAGGRADLGGINDSAGYRPEDGISKIDPYTMATRSKPPTIRAKGKLMTDAIDRANKARAAGDLNGYSAAMEEAEVHRLEIENGWDVATGVNKDAYQKIISDFSGSADALALQDWRSQVVRDDRVRENYTPGASGWSADDIRAGYRMVGRVETMGDSAKRKARGARRPNPTELEP